MSLFSSFQKAQSQIVQQCQVEGFETKSTIYFILFPISDNQSVP